TTNKKDAAVCKGVIAMAREMELQVVAEGVETIEQFNYLKANGCEVFQGYYFARPMAIDQLISWIRENRSAAGCQRCPRSWSGGGLPVEQGGGVVVVVAWVRG